MDSSSAAAECVTLMAAGGAVIHTFPTGQGNVVGNPIVPVIKITANPRTLRTMSEHVDVDVTGILRREMTIDEAGDALIDMIRAHRQWPQHRGRGARSPRVLDDQALRGAFLRTSDVVAGDWPRQSMMGRELAGKTIGLIGYGSIAREVAWRAHMMGMQIVAYDPYLLADHPGWQIARNVSLDAVLELSDVVSLHTPLTDGTRNMINAEALSRMKPDAILINAARGGIVDEAALADALRQGRIGGAALDVFETEPLTAEAGEKFRGVENLVLTPHIAGVTGESNERVSHLIADKVLDALGNKA
jgi:lactate dehydrogenase-like 2-hydroxyacid dehydrogenase